MKQKIAKPRLGRAKGARKAEPKARLDAPDESATQKKLHEITVENIGFAYPSGRTIFENISFTIRAGEILSILGPNGAGKSTLLNCVAGLEKLAAGCVCIDGANLSNMTRREIAQCIGYVPQIISPSFGFSVLDYVVTGCAPHLGVFRRPSDEHYDIAKAAICDMGIEHIQDKAYTQISGGERQQVSIARAIAQRPAVILMDEPTAHLDFGNQVKVLKTICRMKDAGYGVVMTTHNPDHALLLEDRIAVLDKQGALTFGTCDEIMDEQFLLQLYGTDLRLVEVEAVRRRVCMAPRIHT